MTGIAENVTQPDLKKSLNNARLILYPVNIKPGERIIVNQNMLDSIPSNKYSDVTQQSFCPTSNIDTENDGNSSDATIPYVEPIEPIVEDTKPKKKHKILKTNKTFKFNMKVHGIKRR